MPANQSRPSAVHGASDQHARAHHPVGKQGRAGERVRAAAGTAEYRERGEPDVVGDRHDVGPTSATRRDASRSEGPYPGGRS